MKVLADFKNFHQNQPVVVCGCGESLNELAQPERFVTIGVNDVGRRFDPNYLVVVNPPEQFAGDRFRYVENSRAEFLFTQLDLGVKRAGVVRFRLGAFGGTDFSDSHVLHYTNNSPYIALNLAILMGASRIGLIGVDFTSHHFFAETGTHPLAPQFDSINEQYGQLAKAAKARGVEIFNLSKTSRLTAFPKMSVADFAALGATLAADGADPESAETSSGLRIVSYSTMPVAGVPAILARCINARTEHSARCVWLTNSYGNGVAFRGDVEWQNQPRLAESLLSEADLVIVHNGKAAPEHERLLAGKPVVTMAHNYLWNVDERFIRKGFPGVVVGQYQATLDEFKDWSVVPNPIPFWEDDYQPESKPGQITIGYTPSGKHDRYAAGHRLYWHSKGYETTVRILEKLAARYSLGLEMIRDRQIPHAEALRLKRRSHVVIDECVTGSYHRNSLEGLASGAVVVNGLGILPKVGDVLRFCAPRAAEIPFVPATLENLEEVLSGLIESGRENLVRKGAENRRWLENHWNFAEHWETLWMAAIDRSLSRAGRKKRRAKNRDDGLVSAGAEKGRGVKEIKEQVSIVISHGGEYRLPHLRACLANLRQCGGVAEIIVVEMDDAPRAECLARKWADKYLFIERRGAFEKGRALNAGSLLASAEFVVWLDNDLLMKDDFFTRAIAEMRRRELDYLKPYSETFYLSAADSEAVMQGVLSPESCRPAHIDRTFPCGRAEIMRREFLLRVGGIPDGFRGWGGEDNAWAHKANVLGRGGTTDGGAARLFHLFHLLSGGYGGRLHIEANPHYRENVALLEKIYAVRDAEEFLKRFPPPKRPPWDASKKIVFVAGKAEKSRRKAQRVARELEELCAAEIAILNGGADASPAEPVKDRPDALVFFDAEAGRRFLTDRAFAGFAERSILIAADAFAPSDESTGGALVLCEGADGEPAGKKSNVWRWKNESGDDFDCRNLSIALIQPLSLILGQTPPAQPGTNGKRRRKAIRDLPVWFYWEGARPAWIEACHRTILAQNPNARLITPEIFERMWTADRDIELGHLYVAHRADFIRAYLLKNFGGLWVDSDCLVMKDLRFLLDALDEYDFIAHRERNGLFTNDFLAARPESAIAAEFYETVCRTLRRTRSLTWREIGGDPLTKILHETGARFLELPCESIQPICWSEPEKFFAAATDARHALNFDANAICYMLSNGAVNTYLSKHPRAALTAENSFFSFVLRRALNENPTPATRAGENRKNVAGENENRLPELSFYLEMFARLAPRTVLDADVGSGRWAVLLRDFFEPASGWPESRLKIEALVEAEPANRQVLESFYDLLHIGNLADSLRNVEGKKDLMILGDYLTRAGADFQKPEILDAALKVCEYVLLNFQSPDGGGAELPSDGERHLRRCLRSNPAKIAARRRNENLVSVLLSADDPRKLRAAAADFSEIFRRATDSFVQASEESKAGPGCSPAATAEIRRALPLLISHLGVNSLLDARCGDFYWQRRVDLRLEKYFGIDAVPHLVEENERLFGNERRKFLIADVRSDFLPAAELILCRDLLVHLSFADIFAALRNFAAAGAKYLLTTTFPRAAVNAEIKTGEWRAVNLEIAPFNFPPPFRLINERLDDGRGNFSDKSLGLWLISDISGLVN